MWYFWFVLWWSTSEQFPEMLTHDIYIYIYIYMFTPTFSSRVDPYIPTFFLRAVKLWQGCGHGRQCAVGRWPLNSLLCFHGVSPTTPSHLEMRSIVSMRVRLRCTKNWTCTQNNRFPIYSKESESARNSCCARACARICPPNGGPSSKLFIYNKLYIYLFIQCLPIFLLSRFPLGSNAYPKVTMVQKSLEGVHV